MSSSKPQKSGSVRIEHSLNKKENEFVFNRRKYILQSLKKLHIYCSEYEVPNIALLGSGGGERAMVGLLGSLDQFQKTGLLDCVLYLSGVSGSTWCMASLYQEPDWSTKLETLKDKIVQRLSGPGVSWGDAYDKLMKYYEEKDIFSLTDVWAAMFITTYLKENSQLERRRASEPREMTEFNKTRDMEEVDEKRKIIQETRETIRRIDELLSNKDEGQHADYYELRQTALDKMDNLEHGIERTPVLQYNCDLGEMARDLRQIELSDVDPCFYKADEEKQAKCYQIRERVQEVIDKLSRLDYERVPNDADYIELLDAARDLHQSVSEAALKYSDNEDEGQQGMRRGLMELIPVLEPEEKPRDRQWYVVSASGAAPGVSVGHTCVFLPSADGGKGRIVVVGGANPDGSFSDSYVMNLDTHEWEVPEWAGLQARYEHCSFVPEIEPRSVWVFAGAQKSGNRNCVQVLRTSEGLWETVSVKGDPPSVRTYHTNSACVGNRLYVFSGGDAGADAVADTHVHVFDSVTATWTQPESNGTPPTPRHGHAITAVGSDVYIHGGMSGETLHNDMFLLDTETMKWEKVKAKGEIPPGVAAHSSVSFGKNIFIFGGMTSEGATNSMYKFQCDERRWTLLQFEGDLPPGRLDHSMCSVPWRVTTAGRETCDEDEQRLCFIFGGMDTQGVIFNDCLVTLLT